uniref:NADH-ubiquinone oxidoreductase chain 5 n=1 Tax=Asparagopsis taxiformis TaxID=260499 RepID=A0A0E3DAX1_9FLOR|nr:NADH dehydrogenase subunit 5 [Asparagopsis taxiformis]AHX02413.1 NADH dehydrogenase subunit 5 [Asparagopsis taxiformis]
MYLLIVMLPLFGALISGLGGRFLGRYGSSILSTLCVFISSMLSVMVFYEIGVCGNTCFISLNPWVEVGDFKVSWGFLFDSVTAIMLIVITIISSFVHLYSIKYMEFDPHCPRFMAYLEVFTFFMLILVTGDNLIQMFLGWEGVGLASYLLINFWFTRLAANQSALKALVINRIGDFGLSLGIFITFYIFSSIDYLTIFSLVPFFKDYYIIFWGSKFHGLTLIGTFLFIGAVGKSAQLGLHTWLPDAMEGPTPVSALIHAATMVTAGVFLMIRFSPLLEYTPLVLLILVIFGSMTAFFGSMVGVFQNDLKRVIAYSTCSQLGYMILACGISCYNVSLFHLTNHAFFKALLFLSAGSVIHAMSDEQDMRRMGSLINFLPLTYVLMLLGSLSLMGFPFLSGFYSKDFILELSQILFYSNLHLTYGTFACWLGTMSVFFTSFYSVRLIYLTFLNNSNMSRVSLRLVHESSSLIILPLLCLGFLSIVSGYSMKDFFIGIGTDFWSTSVLILPNHSYIIEAEYISIFFKWLPFLFSFIGVLLATIINFSGFIFRDNLKILSSVLFFINKKWYFDVVGNRYLINKFVYFGYFISFKSLDRGFIELMGPYGFSKLVPKWSKMLIYWQTGQIIHYIFYIIMGLLLCLLLINFISIYPISLFVFSFVLIFFI